jgi:YbgC/YbaW family acyl-CoA thioester hydrolase
MTEPKDEKIEQKLPVQITGLEIFPEDIDEYGHVNYKNMPRLFESSQDQYMNNRGIGFEILQKKHGIRSFVKTYQTTMNQQLLVGDELTITTGIGHIGRTSFSFNQQIIKGGESAVDYNIVIVCVDNQGVSTEIPNDVRDALIQEV